MQWMQIEEDVADRPAYEAPAHSRLLTALMNRIECGMLACGPTGELLHANLAAQRELQFARTLRLSDGRVRCVGPSHDAWADALAAAALRQRSGMLDLGDASEPLMVAIMPAHGDGRDTPAAVVMMGRRSVCSPLGLEMLASSRGLTIAECRVLRALVDNRNVREISESHGVTVSTVRTQIQAVRDKLGVRSIDALLLRAAEVPPITALH